MPRAACTILERFSKNRERSRTGRTQVHKTHENSREQQFEGLQGYAHGTHRVSTYILYLVNI